MLQKLTSATVKCQQKSIDDFTHLEWDQSSFMFEVPICILNHFDGENLGSPFEEPEVR